MVRTISVPAPGYEKVAERPLVKDQTRVRTVRWLPVCNVSTMPFEGRPPGTELNVEYQRASELIAKQDKYTWYTSTREAAVVPYDETGCAESHDARAPSQQHHMAECEF